MAEDFGTWEAVEGKSYDGRPDPNALDVYRVGDRSQPIHRGYWGGMAESRLIAAAPEMLAALKLVMVAVALSPKTFAVVNGVIRKAEGR